MSTLKERYIATGIESKSFVHNFGSYEGQTILEFIESERQLAKEEALEALAWHVTMYGGTITSQEIMEMADGLRRI